MTRTTSAPFHHGLTPERIIDAAQKLTRDSHLYGWSIRDLARDLQVTPSVIYHHVGGKDLLAKRVAERVVAAVETPADDLPWQEWFRVLLVDSIYEVAIAHPGVAKWLVLHGVPFLAATPILSSGMARLKDAGFGEQAFVAYSALLNNAMLTVSMGDDRMLHEDDGPRDHASMMEEFRVTFSETPDMAAIAEEFISPFAAGGDTAAKLREQYYRFIVDTTIAGMTAHLGKR